MSGEELHLVIGSILFLSFCQIVIDLITDDRIRKLKDRIVDLEHRKE